MVCINCMIGWCYLNRGLLYWKIDIQVMCYVITFFQDVESLLSRVEQSPPPIIQNAYAAAMKALLEEPLLRHSDVDVKVAIASCISEITRITAPEAPYDDDQMKVCGLFVSSYVLFLLPTY